MADVSQTRALALARVGQTLPTLAQGRPNEVLEVSDKEVLVGTEDSPDGEPVALRYLQQGLALLMSEGSVRIEPETFGNYRRSSFIGAFLGSLPGVEVTDPPVNVHLADPQTLSALFERGCVLSGQPRATDRVSASDDLHQFVVHTLRDSFFGGLLGRNAACKASAEAVRDRSISRGRKPHGLPCSIAW